VVCGPYVSGLCLEFSLINKGKASAVSMKSLPYIVIVMTALASCTLKEPKVFTIPIAHYSATIEFDKVNDYDTLVVWNLFNDNRSSHRRCYRIQNAKRGIVLENGMLPKKATYFDQMTIKTPIKPNTLPNWTISQWLRNHKEGYLSDRPSDKIFKFDSITIDRKKFGVFGIQINNIQTKVIYMTNINHESIEFEFTTNLHAEDLYYQKTLHMMKTIKIKPYH